MSSSAAGRHSSEGPSRPFQNPSNIKSNKAFPNARRWVSDPKVPAALGPEAAAGQEVALGGLERHGAVVVAGVPQATELLDHAGRVGGHQATQVPEHEPEVGLHPPVIRRRVLRLPRLLQHRVRRHLAQLPHVERAVVGQVEVRLDVVIDLRLDGRDLRRVRQLPISPRRPDLRPPDVDVLLGRGGVRGVAAALRPAEEDAEVCVEGVLGLQLDQILRLEWLIRDFDASDLRDLKRLDTPAGATTPLHFVNVE